jgi:hypothetical protein
VTPFDGRAIKSRKNKSVNTIRWSKVRTKETLDNRAIKLDDVMADIISAPSVFKKSDDRFISSTFSHFSGE